MSSEKPPPKDRNWPKDKFGQQEVAAQHWWVLIPLFLILAGLLLPPLSCAKATARDRVIAYCAQDQVFAEPIFQAFEKATGIKVSAVYDLSLIHI